MSHLADHATAIRALADALAAASLAFNGAAMDLEANIAASRVDAACTLDHAGIKTPRCPACNAPRTAR
jgi:hypothetical protein